MEINDEELLKIIEYFCNKNEEKQSNNFELESEIFDKLSYIENKLDELTNNDDLNNLY